LAKFWYVLRCKLNKEHIVAQQLRSQGYEVFCPLSRDQRFKRRRIQSRPYFPGYIFVQVDLEEVSLSTFQWMPNTEGLVSFGLKPAYVPDSLVRAISRHTQKVSGDGDGRIDQGEVVAASDNRKEMLAASDALFDPKLTSDQRVQELLRVLKGMTILPGIRG